MNDLDNRRLGDDYVAAMKMNMILGLARKNERSFLRRDDNISIDGMCAPQSQFSITRNAPWTRVVNGLMATNSFIEFGTNNHTA